MKRTNKKILSVPLVVLIAMLALGFAGPVSVSRAATTVNLGAAANFAVLGFSAVTFTAPASVVSGDVGLSPAAGTL